MPNQKDGLTAANIRYLLAINELDRDSNGAKSNEIAKQLGVSKPSVHTMIKKLCEKGYAQKEKFEAVHLTALGKQIAENYSKQYALLYEKIEHSLGLTPEGCCNAACAILEQTPIYEPPTAKEQEMRICKE